MCSRRHRFNFVKGVSGRLSESAWSDPSAVGTRGGRREQAGGHPIRVSLPSAGGAFGHRPQPWDVASLERVVRPWLCAVQSTFWKL